jgi:hypothetical protein
MKSLKLDPKTNDLLIVDGNFVYIDGPEEVGQVLKTRLQVYQGEFFYDSSFGVPYLQTLASQNGQLALDISIKNTILSTEGIKEIIQFQTEFDSVNRIYTVNTIIKLDDGTEVTFSTPITLGDI